MSNSVVVTLLMIFEQIKRERPRAANCLSLMSRFQAQNIPEHMLHGYESDDMDGDRSSRGDSRDEPTAT